MVTPIYQQRCHDILTPILTSRITGNCTLTILDTTDLRSSEKLAKSRFARTRFWLAWIQGGSTFHANIIPPSRRGRIIHGAIYFEDAGQRSPVRDVATIVQYDTIAKCSTAPCGVSVRPGTAPCPRTNGTNFGEIIYS